MGRALIVLDTNALVFWLLGDSRLGPDLHQRLAKEDVVYCSISLWEIAIKHKQGKLELPWTAREISKRLKRVKNVREYTVDSGLWLDSIDLPWEHKDPADRLIVALALHLSCDLASTDGEIKKFYPRTVL